MPGAGVLVCRGLRKRYGRRVAVDDVGFEIAAGERYGLLGPNGAGKTTTVEMLEGLREPDSGSLQVLGIDVARDPGALKERIGVALQTAQLYPMLTVTEVLDLFRSFYRRSLPSEQLIEFLDLGERRNGRTSELSGGQRQRLAVALALVNDPEVVFLDEPTTGLDPAARRALWELVKRLQEQGKTILLTTHYMEEAEVLCDRLAIMDHGRVLEMGTVNELVGRHFQERSPGFRQPSVPDRARRRDVDHPSGRQLAHGVDTHRAPGLDLQPLIVAWQIAGAHVVRHDFQKTQRRILGEVHDGPASRVPPARPS